MDYIISERRLIRLIDDYIKESFGKLKKIPSGHLNASEGDFDILSEDGKTLFTFVDHGLSIYTSFYHTLMRLFNLTGVQIEHLIGLWFKEHFPDELLLDVFCSIY
jgi:hypothetical protein